MNLLTEGTYLDFIADICLIVSGLGCLYLSIASIIVLNFPRRRVIATGDDVPVSVLKPLCGGEPDLSARLFSLCIQDYKAPIQVVCGVQSHCDPASDVVKQVAVKSPGAMVKLIADPSEHGCNRKVSNLANLSRSAEHELLVMMDSDIEVDHNYLTEIVAHLQRPGVGAVTCLYHGVAKCGPWSRQAALAINTHLLPSVVLALTLGLAHPCFGSTIAMRRSTLARLGGFQAFADSLADDYEMGAAVRSAGYKVAIPTFSVGHACFEDNLRALLAHELRAARTIKSLVPLRYCGTIVAHPLPLALIGASLGDGYATLLIVVAFACRGVLCRCVEHSFKLPRQPYLLLAPRDLLSFAIFVLSFFGASVKWRGVAYRVTAGGKLNPKPNRAT